MTGTPWNSSNEPPDWVTEPIAEPVQNAATGGQSDGTRVYRSQSNQTKSSGTAGTAVGQAFTLTGGLSEATVMWLEARGLDAELCDRLGLATAIGRDGGEWLAIPFAGDSGIVNRKYRSITDKKFTQDKGGKQCFWNLKSLFDRSLAGQPIIICEGELDAIVAIQSGFGRVVSVPGGAPNEPTKSEGKYAFLADVLDRLRDEKKFILAVDGDGPGQALLHDLALRIGRGRCCYVTYPKGCKDLNDVLLGWDAGAVNECINRARWCHVPGLSLLQDLPPLPEPRAYDCGIYGFDRHYLIRKGDFSVTTGIPNSGKTTVWNDITCRMAQRHGWRTCFASFEQPPQTQHARNLRGWFHKKAPGYLKPDEIAKADEWINQHFSFVTPPEDEPSNLDWLLECLASAVIRYGADLCVVDPWNELEHDVPRDMTLTQYTNNAIRTLKRFARKYDVHLVVCAHPTKMQKDKDGNVYRPTLYDISDSAAWYNKADVGMIIHPRKTDGGRWVTEAHVQKTKYHDQIGKPGLIQLVFNPNDYRYYAA